MINRLEATIASVDSAAQANEHNALYIASHWSRLAVGCGFNRALLLLPSFRWSLSPLLLRAGAALRVVITSRSTPLTRLGTHQRAGRVTHASPESANVTEPSSCSRHQPVRPAACFTCT